MTVILRLLRFVCILFSLLFICNFGTTSMVLADGGAPQLAYIGGASVGVGIIDIGQRRVTGTMNPGDVPDMILLSPDGQALYLTQPKLGRVAVLAAKTGKTLCSIGISGHPSLLALSLDASVLYAAGPGDTRVWAINPSNCAIQRTFETHEPVYGLAVTADTSVNATPSTPNQLWIAGSTSLTVFNVMGGFLGSVPLAGGPQYISIPGGFTAYVTTRQGSVVAVDLNSRKLIRTLISGGQFGPMDYDATTGKVYVPDKQHHLLDVLTPVTAGSTIPTEPGRVWHVDGSPQSIAITSDGQFGFVALASGQVEMLDIPARSTVTNISVGGTPHFIITGLYPPATTSAATATSKDQSLSTTFYSWLLLVLLVLLVGLSWLFRRRIRKWLALRQG